MTVADETEKVVPGDCIFIPSNAPHGLINDGKEMLKYFSAAAPAFNGNNWENSGHLEVRQRQKNKPYILLVQYIDINLF